MKKTIWTFVTLIVIAGAVYLYATRDINMDTPVDTVTPAPVQTASSTENTPQVAAATTYTIDSSQSSATYTLGEELRGKPFTVVGKSQAITGTVYVNTGKPAESMVNTIKIDARTFKTDSDQRDNAVARFILKSENSANTYITFTPKSVSGMPTAIEANTEYSFKVTGDLTIAGVTKSQTFDVKAKGDTDWNIVSGTATGRVNRNDYSLTIPNIPFVANVDQAVDLKFDFVFKKQ